MKAKRAILWFKNELRLEDNEIVFRASAQADFVLPVYIFNPVHFQKHKLGFPQIGSIRAQFLIESIIALRTSLLQAGANLHVWIGKPEEILPVLCKQLKINSVYASHEVTSNELAVLQAVESSLKSIGTNLSLHWQNSLYHIEDIPWPIHRIPSTFTQFRKETENQTRVRELSLTPDFIPYQKEIESGEIPSLASFGLIPKEKDTRSVLSFLGGAAEGKKRMRDYIWSKDLLRTYKETRNELLGSDYSSKLSPWLALGCLSTKSIYQEVMRYEQERVKNDSTYWFVFELLWRDYFRFTANKNGAKIFQQKGINTKSIFFKNDILLFERWRNGETGNTFIDANMKELLHSGYMSNRGRQNVASYLTKDLHLNWTWGAAWFESQLIDYDASSNWLNWAYHAGVGNDPEENRYFNTESQVKKYDPKGKYVSHWLEASTALKNSESTDHKVENKAVLSLPCNPPV